jgi:hypothetical protein
LVKIFAFVESSRGTSKLVCRQGFFTFIVMDTPQMRSRDNVHRLNGTQQWEVGLALFPIISEQNFEV